MEARIKTEAKRRQNNTLIKTEAEWRHVLKRRPNGGKIIHSLKRSQNGAHQIGGRIEARIKTEVKRRQNRAH